MKMKDVLFEELVKNGYSQLKYGKKVWEAANRSFLYMTPELVKSFLKLRQHPRYVKTITEIETQLLKKHAQSIARGLSGLSFNLIDMGCEDGSKAKALLESVNGKSKVKFCSVNVSRELAEMALKNIKTADFNNVEELEVCIADFKSLYEVVTKIKSLKYKKNVILLLGSILASFEIHDYLFNLSQSMFKEDVLIIGNGIRVGERFVNIENYKGVLFKEWFSHIIKEFGFNFDEVEYDARFENGRLEIFYKIKKNKILNYKRKKIEFKAGDEIVVGILYKYYEKELEEFCRMYFREVELVKDEDNEYALVICKK